MAEGHQFRPRWGGWRPLEALPGAIQGWTWLAGEWTVMDR
jgi:hypothetical protein